MVRRAFRWLRRLGVRLAVAALAFAVVSWFLIDWTDEGADDYAGGVVLRDRSGEVLRVALGQNDTDCRPYYTADPEDWIVKALVAVEDGAYWTHCGVRPLSILRAAFQNLFYRRRISGASTITMQAVRLIKPHPKTYWWKYKEAIQALKMERAKDKRWILSQYLNRAPYGSNFVGIEAAARGWFGKGAKDLGIGEAAILAGMVQAPSRFRPDRSLDAALKRRVYVLERMLELGYITKEQKAAAETVRPVVCRSPRPFKAPHFCDWYLQELVRTHPDAAAGGDYVTTLDANLQHLAENAVNRASEQGGFSASAVILRADTGDVEAMACSGNYFEEQVNTALAPRPAGSTLKPFLTALAMDRGLVTPEERLADIPRAYRGYRPANFDATHRGLVTARDALVLSLNVPFVQLLQRTGLGEFATTLRHLGFAHMAEPDETFGLGMAIGNSEVTLLELARAYATFARGGCAAPPAAERIFSEGSAFLVSDMLSGDERASVSAGHVADVRISRFAWKTGTSSAYRDAWTVAWNPEHVVAVWCGHLTGGFGDKTLVGAKAAAPVALQLARAIYPRNDGPWFAQPEEVKSREICALTGLPAGASCPKTETGRYIEGRSANRPCGVHVRDASGNVVVREDPSIAAFKGRLAQAGHLEIAKPEDGAVLKLVPGVAQQKVVCQVVGNPDGARLWWFADGAAMGETRGSDPFVLDMAEGAHVILCANESGITATVRIAVTIPPQHR